MSEALMHLLEQAEQQKLEMEMRILHAKNLEQFKNHAPRIYERICDYQASKVVLKLDPNKKINLINLDTRTWFYNDVPLSIVNQQIDSFRENAKVRKFHVVKSPVQNEEHFHIRDLNYLLHLYAEKEVERITHTPKLITNLIISGVGLGYHIPLLLKEFNIKNLLIYENCLDTFYASLFTIDWGPVLNHFSQAHHSIIFCVGVGPEKAMEHIESAIHNLGLHTHMYSFIFRHSNRACERDFILTYNNEIRSFIGGLGYFDDEQIGFAHAWHNLNSEHAVFKTKPKAKRLARLVIAGNGPSLDTHQDYLKQQRENLIIFSCGTALASLIRMGVKPDFHVEMERPSFVEDALNIGTTQEQRKGITLLCLHTVSPLTIGCFDEACFAIKPNDAGSNLVHQYFSPEKLPELGFSNPTVTNCALAYALAMGFRDIHLVGVDLGMQEDDKHHSVNSIYHDISTAADIENYGTTLNPDDRYLEGNFGGKVRVPTVLDNARSSMERLLELATATVKGFNCVNSNNGVKIKNALACKVEDLSSAPEIDKEREVSRIKKDHFLRKNNKSFGEPDDYLKTFKQFQPAMYLEVGVQTEEQLYHAAGKIFSALRRVSDPTTLFLVRGSINCFLGAIFENTLYCSSKEDFIERVRLGTRAYNHFINCIYKFINEDPIKIDDTINTYMRKTVEEKNKTVEKANKSLAH